jgi:hypothetical protein
MITRKRLHEIAAEAQHNPRAARYLVRPLTAPQPYPMRTGEEAMPAVVAQFAVEHPEDTRAYRVISIAVSHAGYAIWCGDKFTQGDVTPLEASLRVGMALDGVAHAYREGARSAMMALYGAYPHRAPCHFWEAWHSHQGVCKHVAAALQYIEAGTAAGLEGLLLEMDEMLQSLSTAPLLALLSWPQAASQVPPNTPDTPADPLPSAPPPAAPGGATGPAYLANMWSWGAWWHQIRKGPGTPG